MYRKNIRTGDASNRRLGSAKEDMACEYLKSQGYKIVDRNFHAGRFSEIDIIARDSDGYLCFVEVKYRTDAVHGGYEGTIDHEKITNISRGATFYIAKKHLPDDTPIRFDVIFILGDDISLIKNAFDYNGW